MYRGVLYIEMGRKSDVEADLGSRQPTGSVYPLILLASP